MKEKISNIPIEGNRLVALFFIVSLFIFYFSSPDGNTAYDYFTRLADAFLQGKTYLTENPPWLNELIPSDGNKYFVPYPPMPAVVTLPFRLVFGSLFAQQWLAHLLGAGTVALTVKLSQQLLPKKRKTSIWVGLFAGFSTVLWFLSSVGSSWYLGQVSAAFFLTAALISAFKSRPELTGLLLGAAYLSRVHTILSLPVFMYIFWGRSKNFKTLLLIVCYFLPFILFNFWYNYARFGVIWDKGYMLIPGVLDEPWYQLGLVHPSYVRRHLDIIFAALPVFQNAFPYILPSWSGLALWITTPALIFSFFAPLKNKLVLATWMSAFLVSLPILMHGTSGFAQFGYRFFIDLLPLFVLLVIINFKRYKLRNIHWILLTIGILVNLWGVLWINKMGWVVV